MLIYMFQLGPSPTPSLPLSPSLSLSFLLPLPLSFTRSREMRACSNSQKSCSVLCLSIPPVPSPLEHLAKKVDFSWGEIFTTLNGDPLATHCARHSSLRSPGCTRSTIS